MNRAQGIFGGDAADGTRCKTGLHHFFIRVDDKAGGVDDTAAFFPVSADLVRVLWHFQSVADGEGRAGLLNHLFGFVEGVDGQGNDVDIFFFELDDLRLVVG